MSTFPLPDRVTEWTSPAGDVHRGQQIKIKGEPGRYKFLAYVDADAPHVEAVSVKGTASIRAFRPERVVRVFSKAALVPNRLR